MIAQERDKIKITQEEEKVKREIQNPLTDYREYLESLSEEQRKYLESLSEEELALQLELHRKLLEKRKALRDPEKRKELERERWKARYGTQEQKENRTQDPQEENKNSQPERTPQPIELEPEPEPKPEYEPIEEPSQEPNPQQNQRKRFLSLDEKRHVWSNPAKLPPEERRYVFRESAKKKASGIFVYLEVNQEGKPVDAGLVRTIPTLRIVDARVRQKRNRILMHPYSITIPEGFWQRWKTARTPQDRLKLTKALELLTDKAVRKIDKVVLDIDTPFDIAKPKLLEIFQMLGITQGYELGRTKSGNLRAIIYLEDDLNAQKEFRKKLHIERAREMYHILVELFKRYGLELDRTFADRINHPVWLSFDRRFYQRDIKVSGTVRFFDLYRAVKEWQSQNQVWEVENINLTQKFWGDRRASKGRKKILIRLPAFLRNELKTTFDEDYKLALWKKAVKSLYKGKGGRFLNFIMPAIGWAKYLGLDRLEVDRYLESFLSDRDPKKIEKDLKTAWRVARELEFNLPEGKVETKTRLLTTDLITLTEKAINFIAERGEVFRQDLLKEILGGQEWLLYKVMGYLEKKGLVESFFQKGEGRGRPSKGYRLTEKAKELSTSLDTQGFEVGQNPILRVEPYPKTSETPTVIEKNSQIENMNKLNYNNSLQRASLGVGGFIETTNLPKPVDPGLTKPVEEVDNPTKSSGFAKPVDKLPGEYKTDCQTDYQTDPELKEVYETHEVSGNYQEVRLVFLRELQDDELVRVRELVSRYENPEGIELILEVSGQRLETGLRVSLAITQLRELRELGVEVAIEETHEPSADLPTEEVLPPEAVLPQEETLEPAYETAYEKTPPAPSEEIEEGLEEIPEEFLREFLGEEGQQQKKKGIGIKGVIKELERLVRGYARIMECLEGMERAIEKLPDAKVKKKALRRLDELTEALRVLEHTLEMVKATLGQKTRIGKGVIKELERLVRGYARVMERLERIEMKRAIEKLPIEKLPDAKVKEEALRHLDEIREMLTEGIRGVEHILEMAKATLERRKKVSNSMSVRIGYRAFQIWLNVYRELTLQDLPDKKKKSGLEKFIKLVDEYLRKGHDPEEFMEILKKVMKVQFVRFINGKADLESLESLTPSDLVYNFAKYLPIALYDRIMAEHMRRVKEYAKEILGEDYWKAKELFEWEL